MSGQPVDTQRLRHDIDASLAAGDTGKALACFARLWGCDPSPGAAGFGLARFRDVAASAATCSARVAILRSFTVEPVVPLLRAGALAAGVHLDVHLGGFNTCAQDVLDPNSSLYHFDPDIVFLAVQTRDVAPELWDDFTDLPAEDVSAAADGIVRSFEHWVWAFRSRSQAHLVVHTLEAPPIAHAGLLDANGEHSQVASIRELNRRLGEVARRHAGVYLLDYDELVSRHGRHAWHDDVKWMTMRAPIAAGCLIHMANEWLRFVHPLVGRVCKVLVTDLDNTLWGGVIGEDGRDGIRLGSDHPGVAYKQLQRAVLDLYHRGIVLAVCSKNNEADAMDALEHHPGMLLRPEHFAALRLNWADKATNLRDLAAELNVGLDAVAFLDDNPAEREWVRERLPEVTVIEWDDPVACAGALRALPIFERPGVSDEDRRRGRYYAEQRQRAALARSVASLEDFYESLGMEAEIEEVTPRTIARVAQLTQKTNQFNLTARRYSEQDIAAMADDPVWRVHTLRLRDRFGDNGLVGVAITKLDDGVCEIDTLLLSCRVIGRTVETALLARVIDAARESGAAKVVGRYRATKKNAPAGDTYERHGFVRTAMHDDGTCWEFDLASGTIETPRWIRCLQPL